MDALLAVGAVGFLLLAFWTIGWWRWFWGGLALYVGVFELGSRWVTGQTLSQQYWHWSENASFWWLPALLVACGGIGLGLHLVWKRLRRKP